MHKNYNSRNNLNTFTSGIQLEKPTNQQTVISSPG